MTLHEKLIDIQQNLKVPKGQNNEFGGFKYRKIEDIEDKVKPFLKEHKLTLRFVDRPVAVGNRVYIESTAVLGDGTDMITTIGYARETDTPRAKMDESQLTGSCSSYARKYAAGGMFLIDDTADADSNGSTPKQKQPAGKSPKDTDPVTPKQKQQIKNMLSALDMDKEAMGMFIESVLEKPTVDTFADFNAVIKAMKETA